MEQFQKEIIDLVIDTYGLDIRGENENFLYWIKKDEVLSGWIPDPNGSETPFLHGASGGKNIYVNEKMSDRGVCFEDFAQEVYDKKPKRAEWSIALKTEIILRYSKIYGEIRFFS